MKLVQGRDGWWASCVADPRGLRLRACSAVLGAERRVAVEGGLRGWFFEGIGDRVLEAQRAAFARCGVPCIGPTECAGGFEELLVESRLDRVLRVVIAVCASGADERRGALWVAVHRGDRRQAAKALKGVRPDDHLGAEREFLPKCVRSGVGLAGQQRGQAKIPAVDQSNERLVQRVCDRSRARGKVRCVTLAAET